MARYQKALVALGIGLTSLLGFAEPSSAQENPITAIDIALARPIHPTCAPC